MRKHQLLPILLLSLLFGLISVFLISTSGSHIPITIREQSLSPLPTPTQPVDLPPGLSKEEQVALRYVADLTHTPIEKLYVGAPAYIKLIDSDHSLWQANVSEINSDNAHIVTIDLDTYEVVDGAALAAQEQESQLTKYGKYEPALYERLQSATENDVLSISVWFSGVDVEKIRSNIFSKYPDMGLIELRPGPTTDLKLYDQVFAEATAAETKVYQEQA